MRKSMSYLENQVSQGLADWINAADQRKGIIACEMLYFGPRAYRPAEPGRDTVALPHLTYRGPIAPWRVGRMIRETPQQCVMLEAYV